MPVYKSPAHEFWHRRLEPQIREVMKLHPEWFAFREEGERHAIVNSIAKRVVGQVVAGMRELYGPEMPETSLQSQPRRDMVNGEAKRSESGA